MRAVTSKDQKTGGPPTGRTLLVIALLTLLFGLVEFGEIVEYSLRVSRNKMLPANPSGQIVLVGIDDKSQAELGRWPWPRRVQAELVNRLTDAGVKRIAFDMTYEYPTNSLDDLRFAQALKRSKLVVLPVRTRLSDGSRIVLGQPPISLFQRDTVMASYTTRFNYQSAVWTMPYAWSIDGQSIPSLAAALVDVSGPPGAEFPIDFRYRMNRFRFVSAGDIISGRTNLSSLRGTRVLIGLTANTLGDQVTIPGRGRFGGVYNHLYAAETLLAGRPISVGFLPGMLFALLLSGAALRVPRFRYQMAILGSGSMVLLALPLLTETHHIYFDITTGLFALLASGTTLLRRRYRTRAFINSATGLPNLEALRALRDNNDRPLIVAKVLNYAQLGATLNVAEEGALVHQITARLGVGTRELTVFQGGEGIFAWLAQPGTPVGHHVEALHSLFRSPARIGTNNYDLAVAFGVEIGSGRTIANRLGSAMVAADEASAEGLKWKYHDPERQKDAGWRLSLLAQLDEAIERGEVWVAFQPQLDLATGRIRGAEALARWTHPEKGPISPHEFITAAEQFGRIDGLTMFVLDQSIEAAAKINRDHGPFDIAVNLSARTLARRSLPADVRRLLDKHGLAPSRLTLELTETAAMASDGSDLDPLFRLRDLGVRLSIDDYGTGMSTLEYLKTVPASEIKIDQSFIKSINDNRSDQLMVRSTIALAHSLGRKVVAEGVETEETLTVLKSMNCDTVQGFLIGRPSSYSGLVRRLTLVAKGRAA